MPNVTPASRYPQRGKRIFDVVVSATAIALLAIPLALVALAIKLSSRGPVFYTQARVGKDGREFKLLKFRTMRVGADKAGSVTVAGDSRVTGIGHVLRKYKVDELPQIVNVLTGDMSIVGPRPTVREDADRMTEAQRQRFRAVPGITGLAQVNGNTGLFWEERIQYDLDYIARCSLALDLRIILTTFAMIVKSKIESHPPGDSEWRD